MTAMVILLCLVCLTGATLALFTGNVDDGTIGIVATSGNIEVAIVDEKTDESLVGKVLNFDGEDVSEGVLFEPGAIFHTKGFKVKNTGNIPINFRLYISNDENIDMQEFNRAFEVWISTSPNDSTGALSLPKFQGELEEQGERSEHTYYLFIKMKETAGNEFQGKIYTGIGVTVYAVQGNADIGE